jgi:hypothetical protein
MHAAHVSRQRSRHVTLEELVSGYSHGGRAGVDLGPHQLGHAGHEFISAEVNGVEVTCAEPPGNHTPRVLLLPEGGVVRRAALRLELARQGLGDRLEQGRAPGIPLVHPRSAIAAAAAAARGTVVVRFDDCVSAGVTRGGKLDEAPMLAPRHHSVAGGAHGAEGGRARGGAGEGGGGGSCTLGGGGRGGCKGGGGGGGGFVSLVSVGVRARASAERGDGVAAHHEGIRDTLLVCPEDIVTVLSEVCSGGGTRHRDDSPGAAARVDGCGGYGGCGGGCGGSGGGGATENCGGGGGEG